MGTIFEVAKTVMIYGLGSVLGGMAVIGFVLAMLAVTSAICDKLGTVGLGWMKLRQCPNCGSKEVYLMRTGPSTRYYCECLECHWCGKVDRFGFIAKLLWNCQRRK